MSSSFLNGSIYHRLLLASERRLSERGKGGVVCEGGAVAEPRLSPAPLQNCDCWSRAAPDSGSVTGAVTAEIVPRVLTFLHGWFGGVVGARPLTLQMPLSNDKSGTNAPL